MVDDDSLVLFSVAAMLEDLGHDVVEKVNAADAYTLLEHDDTIDLVITDHAMPQMTGAELAEAVHQKWPSLPLILASGYTEQLQLPAYLPKLTKPFSQDTLMKALCEVIVTD